MFFVSVSGVVVVVFSSVLLVSRASLETCTRECGLPEREGYCPVRSAPTQVFDGRDGVDVEFDLANRSLNFSLCNQTNFSTLGFHWWSVTGQGYSTQGGSIERLSSGVGRALNASESTPGVVVLADLNTSFSYYGHPVRAFYVLTSGVVGMDTSDIESPTNLERFLRFFYWPNLVACVLCSTTTTPDESRVFFDLRDKGTIDERVVLSFAPAEDATPSYQASFYARTNRIQFSWFDVSLENTSAVVGLSHGTTPEWKALAYDALDLSSSIGCVRAENCTVETEVRPVGRTRPPDARPYPWAIAPAYNPHPQFCHLGCSYYYTNWTLLGCRAACDAFYDYDVSTEYSDRAEVARRECYDGCRIGNLRCQPGSFCFTGIMRSCPPGKYRDQDYHHVTRCDDCPHGRYREISGGRYLESCDKCDIGRYNTLRGSSSKDACVLCPPGRFANEPGMQQCKCTHHYDGVFDLTPDSRVIYPECGPEDYLDDTLRPELHSIDYSPRTTYP